MKDDSGSIRTGIQGQGVGAVAAAVERGAGGGGARVGRWGRDIGALARAGAVQARSRAGLDCGRPAGGRDHDGSRARAHVVATLGISLLNAVAIAAVLALFEGPVLDFFSSPLSADASAVLRIVAALVLIEPFVSSLSELEKIAGSARLVALGALGYWIAYVASVGAILWSGQASAALIWIACLVARGALAAVLATDALRRRGALAKQLVPRPAGDVPKPVERGRMTAPHS